MMSKRKISALLVAPFVLLLLVVLTYTPRSDSKAPSTHDLQATQEAKDFLESSSPNLVPGLSKPSPGEIFAVLTIPKIGVSYPVKEGTDLPILEAAVGHYSSTQLPGELGNTGLAGHVCCREHGSPFRRLNELRPGDQVVLDTKSASYEYSVLAMPACGPDMPQLVDQSNISVLHPTPCDTTHPPKSSYITMTTCYPEGPDPTPVRLIVWAELKRSIAR